MKSHLMATPVLLVLLIVFLPQTQGQGVRTLFNCDFESDTCSMAQLRNDNGDWVRQSGGTPSGNTGPNTGADGSRFYMFIEASSPLQDGNFVTLATTPIAYSGSVCVRFKYHMFGQHIGYLKVYTTDKNTAPFDLSGAQQSAQGDPYRDAAVDINIVFNQQINFEASRGRGVFSDTAIDTIRVIAGTCNNPITVGPSTTRPVTNTPPVVTPGETCPNGNAISFETGRATECNSVQAFDDQFDWTVLGQATASTETGPTGASSGRFYIHIEASSPRRTGDTARLILRRPGISGTVCVRFSYNMYGHHIGKLEFYATANNARTILWRLEGQQQTRQDRNWRDGAVEINNNQISEMGLIGTRGTGFTSDIAVDNIRYNAGQCESTPSGFIYACDFELRAQTNIPTLCGITQDNFDNFDWIQKRGPTPSPVTGPNSANNGEYYMFIEASSPRVQGNQATIFLPVDTTGSVCVTFAVSMFGWHMGTFEVIRRRGNDNAVAYTRRGQWDSAWHDVRVTVDQLQRGDRIGFRGTRGTGYSGDIGLDKIRVRPNAC